MLRITAPYLFLLFCLASICQSAELTADELIQGVNQARLIIRSGEIHALLVDMRGHAMSDAEIAIWKSNRTEEWLKLFKPGPDESQADSIKAYKENYLNPSVDFHAKASLRHPLRQRVTTCFHILPPVPEMATDFYQYKIALQEVDGLSLDSESAPFTHDSDFYLLTYDAQKQVKQDIGTVSFAANSRYATQFFNGDNYLGYWNPEYCGKAPQIVPTDAKLQGKERVNGAECYILAYTASDGRYVKIWIDVAKDFAIRRNKITYPSDVLFKYSQADYKAFRRFGDIWYPGVSQFSISKKDGTLQTQRTIEVKAAEFNVDFPKDFFKIDRDFFGLSEQPPEMGTFADPRILPAPASTETDKLLLCGPKSLSRVCELLKVETNLSELKKLSGFNSNRGTTMLGLKEAATYKGLAPTGIRATIELLRRKKVPLPAIAYVNNNHFLVFEAVEKEKVKVYDPAQKYAPHVAWDELSEIWDGDLLIFEKKKARRTKQKQTPLAFTDAPEYNFGKVLGGSEVKHTFTLKNIGRKPLKILSVKETCACTASVLSQDEIPPGKTGEISAVLTVPSGNQQVKESLLVLTDDPVQSTLILTLKGEAFTPLKTFPERLAFGNQKPLQAPLTKRVSLHLQGGVELLSIRTNSEHLKATLETKNEIPHIEVKFLPTLPVGQFSHSLMVDYTYKGEQTTHNVLAFGEVLGELQVVPNRLFFGLIKDPSAAAKTITISSRNKQPFQITDVESGTQAVKVTVNEGESETHYQVTTSLAPKAAAGEFSGEIIIHTSSRIQPTVRVPFFGIIADDN